MMYFAGWDGGGTKTAMELRDREGNLLCTAAAGPLNYNSCGPRQVRQTVCTLLAAMADFGSLENCGGLCIAAAGISNSEAGDFLRSTLAEEGYRGKLRIVGDQEAALRGGVGRQPGMVLISGTGSICFGTDSRGRTWRAGGFGHLIDDEGSGYAIGRDILSAYVRQCDGRMEKTWLHDAVPARLNAHGVGDVIHYVYQNAGAKQNIAALAPLLPEAWEQGDPAAEEIADRAGAALGELVTAVARELKLESAVLALAGGILEHYRPVREALQRVLARELPELRVIPARQNAAAGAALLAVDLGTEGEENHA